MKTILLFTVLTITTIVNSQIVENKGIDGMIKIGNIYVDKYEAPNAPGESPFVMFSYLEAQNWCVDRGKRLLFDDEWEMIASGPLLLPYVYGTSYNSLICNDSKLWRAPNQTLINLWPIGISNLNKISSFSGLIDSVKNISTNAAQSADHVMFLYQGESAGVNSNCFSYYEETAALLIFMEILKVVIGLRQGQFKVILRLTEILIGTTKLVSDVQKIH
jgi:hypothetical protein